MDKKRQLLFNTNNFLLAMSLVLDKAEANINNTSANHLKRVAYLSLKIGQKFNLSNEQLSDLCTYALGHSIALYSYANDIKAYCEEGEEIINAFALLTSEKNIIKYHKELYDGSGVFGLKKEEIPLFSQILSFCDLIDTKFDLSNADIEHRSAICAFIKQNEEKLFSLDMSEIFCDELAIIPSFWLDLQHEQQVMHFIFQTVHDYSNPLDFEDVLSITSKITLLVNPQSKLLEKVKQMAHHYNMEHKDTQTLLIAASLCMLGKLALPIELKEKSPLNEAEHTLIESYPYYTRMVLSNIMGFNDIASWASKIQERVDGSGYPDALEAKDISFKDRVLSSLVVYESLTNKAYAPKLSSEDAIALMQDMATKGQLDGAIIADIKSVLL